jgi:hypothetical protein
MKKYNRNNSVSIKNYKYIHRKCKKKNKLICIKSFIEFILHENLSMSILNKKIIMC